MSRGSRFNETDPKAFAIEKFNPRQASPKCPLCLNELELVEIVHGDMTSTAVYECKTRNCVLTVVRLSF